MECSDDLDDGIDDKPAPSIWDQPFPKIHTIQVKRKGRKAGWEEVRVELTSHRDRHRNRARRVWTTLIDNEDTAGLFWDLTDEKVNRSTLSKDREENVYDMETELEDDAREFTVTEKMCGDGRRMWKGVIKKGGVSDEEDEKGWEEMMEKEGFNADLEQNQGTTSATNCASDSKVGDMRGVLFSPLVTVRDLKRAEYINVGLS